MLWRVQHYSFVIIWLKLLANELGFKSSLADPDLWYKSTTAPDRFEYYSYILVYCDDLLIIDKNPASKMEMIKTSFTVKSSSIGEHTAYLGTHINKVYAWTMGSQSYSEQAITTLKKRLEKRVIVIIRNSQNIKVSSQTWYVSRMYRWPSHIVAKHDRYP